jgi:hypothetical protein
MTLRSRLVCVISCSAILYGAACSSDSTGPSASRLAQHFDSLYSAAVANGSIGYAIRAQEISELEIAAAFGAIPRDVRVTTANGVEHWKGFEFMTNPNGGPFEFNNIVIAYRDADAHTIFDARYAPDGSITSAWLLVNDTLQLFTSDISGRSALTSSHAGCPAPPTLANPNMVWYTLPACASAHFLSSASAEFGIVPSVDGALSHLAFGSTVFPGETFTSGFTDTLTRLVH